MNLVKNADQFGAVFKPTIKLRATKYKTFQGGIISIIIYGLSLAYFVYGIQLWATNQILPNITDFKQVADIVEYHSTKSILSFKPFQFPDQINPFDRSNIILMAIIYQIKDGIATQNSRRLKLQNGWINVDNFDLILDNRNESVPVISESQIFLTQCIPQLLEVGEQCASDNIMKKFWAQTNIMMYRLHSEQYNFHTRSLQQIVKQYFLLYRQDASSINYLQLQKANSYVDEGFLFPNMRQYDYVSDISQQLQGLTIEQGVALYKLNIFLCFNIRMDIVFQVQNIAYANISSVLANIGSIVSLLLFFSYFAILINQRSLEDDAKFDIIKIFYPQIKDVVMNKNCFGYIKSIQNVETNLFYDVKEYQQYYKRLSQIAEQKLCISNLIFEVSRLQFAIQQLVSKEEIIKLRDKHFQISLQPQNIKQREIAKIKQSSFNQIYPSNDSRIIEIYDEKEDELAQGQKYGKNDKQTEINFPIENQINQKEFSSDISDFALFCQQIINNEQ